MLPEFEAFKRAFEGLSSFLLDPEDAEHAKVVNLYNYVANKFPAVRRQEFDTVLPEGVTGLDMREQRRSLILKPPNEQKCIPVLFVKFIATEVLDKRKQPSLGKIECRIVLGLFTVDTTIRPADDGAIRAIGLRFELSEGDGIHDYAHVQLVKSMRKGVDDLQGAPPWLPDTQPAIPLDADPRDASALIVSVVQSLYGPSQAAKFKRHLQGIPFKGVIRPRILSR